MSTRTKVNICTRPVYSSLPLVAPYAHTHRARAAAVPPMKFVLRWSHSKSEPGRASTGANSNAYRPEQSVDWRAATRRTGRGEGAEKKGGSQGGARGSTNKDAGEKEKKKWPFGLLRRRRRLLELLLRPAWGPVPRRICSFGTGTSLDLHIP